MSLVSTLLEVIVLMSTILPAHASGTPASKCAAAKQKAAVKKLGGKLKCYQKASANGVTVDGACLTAAEMKFADAIAKAEAKGGCVDGAAATIESDVDKCLTSIRSDTPDALATCGQSSYPQCGGTCPGDMVCRAVTDEMVSAGGGSCSLPTGSCTTGCRCVDPATACNAKPCDQICYMNSFCQDSVNSESEYCCSGPGGPCDVVSGSPACCCGSCVQQPGSIGTCQTGFGCDPTHNHPICQ